jgi:hypothetical protein
VVELCLRRVGDVPAMNFIKSSPNDTLPLTDDCSSIVLQ